MSYSGLGVVDSEAAGGRREYLHRQVHDDDVRP
jgi:hypothetical protein